VSDDHDVEIHTAEVPGTPLLLLVVTEAGIGVEPLPALEDLPINMLRAFLVHCAPALRAVATNLEAAAADMNGWPDAG
jgi:hypothetical protein